MPIIAQTNMATNTNDNDTSTIIAALLEIYVCGKWICDFISLMFPAMY